MENGKQPLISPPDTLPPTSPAFDADTDGGDIKTVRSFNGFVREFWVESRKQWYIAGPAIFLSVCNYSLSAITQVFGGQLGTIQLAAISVWFSGVGGLAYGIMSGMGSGLETLCGQAFGVGQLELLGIYMQRSWVILGATALMLLIPYIFAAPMLRLIGQKPEIAEAAGAYSMMMIPHLFSMAMSFPLAKFLQAQSKVAAMAVIASVALALHTFFSWLLMLKLGGGLVAAATVLNISSWFVVVAQLLYILSGTSGPAWPGFSWKAFRNLWDFLKLSLRSALMICLQFWYTMILVPLSGYLKDAEVSIDAMATGLNICEWISMVAVGFNISICVRVANELGAGHPNTANFSVAVGAIYSSVFGIAMAFLLMIAREQYPALFTESKQVQQEISKLTPFFAANIVIGSLQPSLCGAIVGAGWQAAISYVNLGCYYLLGFPLAVILAFVFEMGVQGIWWGMISGLCLQSCILLWIIYRTNWNKEASIAGNRVKEWGDKTGDEKSDKESLE